MKDVLWTPGLVIEQGKADNEIYNLDWTKWADGETLVNPPTITPPGGITASLYTINATSVDVRVYGGTEGVTYIIPIKVVSNTHAREDTRNFVIKIIDQ